MQASQGRPSGLLIILIATVLIIGLPVTVFIVNNRPPHISVPSNKMPHPNGWDDFIHATKLIGTMGPISSTRPISSWTLPQYEAFMKSNASALAVVRQGLKKQYMHPRVRSDISKIENYAMFRELARTLAGEAKYYEFIGKPGKAADSLLDCIELGVVIPRGGTMISGLVGTAIEFIGMHFLYPLLPKLSPADMARVSYRLEQIERRRIGFADIMIEEGKFAVVSESQVFKSAFGFIGWPLSPATNVKDRLLFAFKNKTAVIRQTQAYYEAAAREQRGAFTGKSRIRMPSHLLSMGTLSVVKMRQPFAQAEAKMNLLRVDVALRRYKVNQNPYPAKLSQLASAYLKKIPNDPFGGKQLRYKVISSGKSYLLYSIGANCKDDGGNSTLDCLLNSPLTP